MAANELYLARLVNLFKTGVDQFSSDEGFDHIFYDTVSNEIIEVVNQDGKPGERGIVCKIDLPIGTTILQIDPTISYLRHKSKVSEFLHHYESFFDLRFIEQHHQIVILTLRCLLTYMEDEEVRKKLHNLSTHERDFKLNNETCYMVEAIKKPIKNILESFFIQHDISSSISVNNYKFLNSLISLIFINHSILYNVDGKSIGLFLDPTYSLFNHSCIPNSFQDSKDDKYILINSLPLKEQNQVTITYIKLGLPKEIRQYELLQRYYFNCHCELCKLNHDPFFKITCDNCGGTVKSSSLHGLLNTPNFILKQHKCFKCDHDFNINKYEKNITIRNFIISFIVNHDKFNQLDDEAYFKHLLKELFKLIDTTEVKSCIKKLIFSMESFKLSRKLLLQDLMEQVINDKVFPIYTFPFNLISFHLISSENITEQLKYNLRYQILVNIPLDLSHQLKFDEYLYYDIAEQLFYLILNQIEIIPLECLCQCCHFFYKQVISVNEVENIEDKFLRLTLIYSKLSKVSLFQSLKLLFKFANINRVYESEDKKLLIPNALNKLVPIFYNFDIENSL